MNIKERRGHGFHENKLIIGDYLISINFKIMKTVRKILFALIAFALLASCSDAVKYQAVPSIPDISLLKRLNVYAELTCQILEMNDGDAIHFTDKTSCNLSEDITFGLHGKVNLLNNMYQPKKFELLNGYFELFDNTQNSYLSGDFQGQGYKENSEFKIWGIIDVTYGKGIFEADDGELQVVISGTLDPGDDKTMKYTIQIYGCIEKKTQKIN